MPVEPGQNGWFQRHVVECLADLKTDMAQLDTKLDLLAERVTRQEERGKLATGLWGALGGFLAAGGGVLLFFLING